MGLSGVGKSQLAIDYAYEVRDDSSSTWVLWLHASSAARLQQSIRKTLDDLKVPGRTEHAANVYQLLRSWLQNSRHGKWLLILDNVDDAQYLLEHPPEFQQGTDAAPNATHQDRIPDYLPTSTYGSILLTSRTTEAASKIVERKSIIVVEPMGAEHAVELLEKKLDCEHTSEEALELATTLDFMPLAINQAAAYISRMKPRISVSQYLRMLKESDKSKLSLLNINNGDLRRDGEAKNSIIPTWQISFDHIRTVRPSASDLLSLMSFFDRQSIPESVLRRNPVPLVTDQEQPLKKRSRLLRTLRKFQHKRTTSSQIPQGIPETALQDFELDIEMLRSYSLITAAGTNTFTMHNLVQFVTRKWLQARSEEELWIKRFIHILYEAFPKIAKLKDWPVCATLYPHVKVAQSLKPGKQDRLETWACILFECGRNAWERGLQNDARTMATLSFNELVRLKGKESKLAFRSMIFLAEITSKDGSSDTAGHLQAQLVAISEKMHGEDTAIIARCKGILAVSHRTQGRLNEAEVLLLEVVETMGRLLGDEHHETLISMSRLAETYRCQKLYGRAADLGERVLRARDRSRGPSYINTLDAMDFLAMTYMELGLLDKAIALLTKAVKKRSELLGTEHPSTLSSMANLAQAFRLQKSFDKAVPLSAQALEVRRNVLGSEHPDTLRSMHDLALMYYEQGLYNKAIELGSEAFETKKRVFGTERYSTLDTMANLASSLRAAGRRKSATELMELCAARSQDALGPTDSKTVDRQRWASKWRKKLMNSQKEESRHGTDGRAKNVSNEEH